MYKIGFIGAGNMGFPEIKGSVSLLGSDAVTFFEANEERRDYVAKALNVAPAASNNPFEKSELITVIDNS